MNKKVLMFGLPILALALVSAVLVTHYFSVDKEITVNSALLVTGGDSSQVSMNAGTCTDTGIIEAESKTSVNVPIDIDTTFNDTGLTSTTQFLLSASGTQGSEERVFISGADAGVSTLGDLNNMSWDAYVSLGYIPHVDVIIDTNNDGIRDDALVFEYDKVTTPSDQLVSNMNYTRDSWINTFDDKGIVDDNARAWLSSGDAGALNSVGFIDGLLSEWKSGNANENSITSSTKVIGFEIEVDNWILNSDAMIKNLKVNGNLVLVTIEPSDHLNIKEDICSSLATEGTFEVTTNISPR